MKKCTGCKENKSRTLFGKNGRYIRSTCKECTNNSTIASQRITRDYVRSFKDKCAVCSYSNCVEALEFHHISDEEKEFGLGKSRGWSEKTKILVDKEITKCILLCANCHREHHAGVLDLTPYLGT